MSDPGISKDDVAACLRVLEALRGLPVDDPTRAAVSRAADHLRQDAKRARRRARRQAQQAQQRALDEQTGRLRQTAELSVEVTGGSPGRRARGRGCYVCKVRYRVVDAYYHLLCPACAEEHRARREARADLRGRRALVTGGRIKIGFHTALKLLRDGAEVTVTTRFPRDAARRYAREPDVEEWRDRLRIVGIDLRDLPAVVALGEDLAATPWSIVIHNAAQTVRRPEAYYAELAQGEVAGAGGQLPARWLPEAAGALARRHEAWARAEPGEGVVALDRSDVEGLPLDLRATNSWTQALDEVDPAEALETHAINALAPLLLTQRLLPAVRRSEAPDKHLVFVSAVEGQFSYGSKTPRHPHTNMAKAALNMLVRTSAADLARARIYAVAVDTGWITDENPQLRRERARARGFCPPLDVLDGAARVYDPVVRGARGEPVFGVFLKDYRPADW